MLLSNPRADVPSWSYDFAMFLPSLKQPPSFEEGKEGAFLASSIHLLAYHPLLRSPLIPSHYLQLLSFRVSLTVSHLPVSNLSLNAISPGSGASNWTTDLKTESITQRHLTSLEATVAMRDDTFARSTLKTGSHKV